jgi:hypothetical protein
MLVNYSYDKVIYVTKDAKVIITCPDHGDFSQSPDHHLIKAVVVGDARNLTARRTLPLRFNSSQPPRDLFAIPNLLAASSSCNAGVRYLPRVEPSNSPTRR